MRFHPGEIGLSVEAPTWVTQSCFKNAALLLATRMKYTDEEIVAYATCYLRQMDRQKGNRLMLAVIGVGNTVMLFLLVNMLLERSGKDSSLFQDMHFIAGVAFGILLVLVMGIGVLCFVRMLGVFYGKDIEAHRLLVRLYAEKTGQHAA